MTANQKRDAEREKQIKRKLAALEPFAGTDTRQNREREYWLGRAIALFRKRANDERSRAAIKNPPTAAQVAAKRKMRFGQKISGRLAAFLRGSFGRVHR